MSTDDREIKVLIELLAEKLTIKSDLSNLNGLFNKVFLEQYLCLKADKNDLEYSRENNPKLVNVFVKIKDKNKIFYIPIEDFSCDYFDNATVLSIDCELAKRIDITEHHKRTAKIKSELKEDFDIPVLH